MKILGFFIRHPSFSVLYSFSSPGDLSCEPFGILFFLSLSLSLLILSRLVFFIAFYKKINLCFLSQPHFTAIIKTLMQSTLLSLFSVMPSLPWTGRRQPESHFQQSTNTLEWCNNHPGKTLMCALLDRMKKLSKEEGNSSFMELSFLIHYTIVLSRTCRNVLAPAVPSGAAQVALIALAAHLHWQWAVIKAG